MSKVGVCRITSVFIIILFTLSVLGYSQYYLTSLETTKYPSQEITIAMLYVLPGLLVLLYSLLLSNYILCIIIKPQNIDEQYSLTTTEIAQFMIQPNSQGSFQVLSTLTREYVKARPDLQVRERDYRHGGLRICEMCSIIKPDRSHHCGICKRCVMRMDHHCHWVNNCIHEGNHKYFIQCITLGVIISLVTIIHYSINMGCSSCKIIPELSNKDYTVCLLLYMATGLSTLIALLVTFLTLDHCTNMFRGQTSYERVYERDHYNRGWKKNFREIMGQGACEWLCPVAPTKLSPEQEPLIITVIEPSSAAWLETTNNRAYTQYEIEDEEETSSHHSRQSTSSQERSTERSRDVSLDEFADETLSLQQGQLGQRDSSMVTRVRTASTIESAK